MRLNGRAFEALAARVAGREAKDLYHSALTLHCDGVPTIIEMTPSVGGPSGDHGVVVEGPVGVRGVAGVGVLRYEIRCWANGRISDIGEQVAPPLRLSDRAEDARRIIALAPQVPALTWGRDEHGVGEMWNSNSVISWLVKRAELAAEAVRPPRGGRAPGWRAGITVARRATT